MDAISIRVNASQPGRYSIRLLDAGGKLITTANRYFASGSSQAVIDGLGPIARGVYFLEMTNNETGEVSRYSMIKK
jgi:hypothetical protein